MTTSIETFDETAAPNCAGHAELAAAHGVRRNGGGENTIHGAVLVGHGHNNHDSKRAMKNMSDFMNKLSPRFA
jgi:hypothetical protein